jgi:hypothetical protein
MNVLMSNIFGKGIDEMMEITSNIYTCIVKQNVIIIDGNNTRIGRNRLGFEFNDKYSVTICMK